MLNLQGVAEDIHLIDWQLSHIQSPASDVLYNIFTTTDRALRDKEYNNLIKLYYESMSTMMKSLGSDPDKLFTYADLLGELKRCGVNVLLLAPIILLGVHADVSDLDEVLLKAAEGDDKADFVSSISAKDQFAYDQRLNEVFEDIFKLGYYEITHHE